MNLTVGICVTAVKVRGDMVIRLKRVRYIIRARSEGKYQLMDGANNKVTLWAGSNISVLQLPPISVNGPFSICHRFRALLNLAKPK